MRRALVLLACAAVVSATAAPPIWGRVATTLPQVTLFEGVELTDTAITLSLTSVQRGSLVVFTLKNSAKHGRNFSLGGYRTAYITPGKTARFQLNFLYRNHYPYVSLARNARKLTGTFLVY
jgi:hypothetical protein